MHTGNYLLSLQDMTAEPCILKKCTETDHKQAECLPAQLSGPGQVRTMLLSA